VNAGPITVDGYLTDWVSGVDLTLGYDLPAGTLVPTLGGVTYWVEDHVGAQYGYVGPGIGGQNFDVEAAYGILSSGAYYGAFVTGTDRAGEYGSGDTLYRTGDLFLDLNPATDPGWDLAIPLTYHGAFVRGHVYAAPASGTWYEDPGVLPGSTPFRLAGSPTDVTGQFSVAYAYREGMWGEYDHASSLPFLYGAADHNVFEVYLSGDMLLGADGILMHYTQGCGNDLFDLEIPYTVVPEPCTSVLALTALLAGAYVRRRRRHLSIGSSDETE
jgi:hypothetical protein